MEYSVYQMCLVSVLLEEAGHEAVPSLHNDLQLEAGLSNLKHKIYPRFVRFFPCFLEFSRALKDVPAPF
jgi:hypothetical protein